jgi:hypothetical protein
LYWRLEERLAQIAIGKTIANGASKRIVQESIAMRLAMASRAAKSAMTSPKWTPRGDGAGIIKRTGITTTSTSEFISAASQESLGSDERDGGGWLSLHPFVFSELQPNRLQISRNVALYRLIFARLHFIRDCWAAFVNCKLGAKGAESLRADEAICAPTKGDLYGRSQAGS